MRQYKANNLLFIYDFGKTVLNNSQIIKNSAQQLLTYGRNFIPNSMLQLLCCVWAIPVYAHFKYLHRKKSGTVRSGDLRGHGIPGTWKCSSSLINTLHNAPAHCHWTDFEVTWHNLCLGLQTVSPTPTHRVKVRSEMCQSALHHPVLSLYLSFIRTCINFDLFVHFSNIRNSANFF
jgi:hypothetical protein